MSSIIRISKIKNHRAFEQFTWNAGSTKDFSQYNVIYAGNGTGKTTLSRLFAKAQNEERLDEVDGSIEFLLEGHKTVSNTDELGRFVDVRVFNIDFVSKVIGAVEGEGVPPIYYLGEHSVEKQEKLDSLKKELGACRLAKKDRMERKSRVEKELDQFSIVRARMIKEVLAEPSRQYGEYNKASYKKKVAELRGKQDVEHNLLSEVKRNNLLIQKDVKRKPSISKVNLPKWNIESVAVEVQEILNISVVNKILDELDGNRDLREWVQKGLKLHSGVNKSDRCKFCDNEFVLERRTLLERIFGGKFNELQRRIQDAKGSIDTKIRDINDIEISEEHMFYEHKEDDARVAISGVRGGIEAVTQVLEKLKGELGRKEERMSESIYLEQEAKPKGEWDKLVSAINVLNMYIEEHGGYTNDISERKNNALAKLEEHYVLIDLSSFTEIQGKFSVLENECKVESEREAGLCEKINLLERELVEHRKPADEINGELLSYLGHGGLKFETEGSGYRLFRNESVATNLSEGEKMAISFLYFLKSLSDKDVDKTKLVVVIDDPVSSQDSRSLYASFAYMKERVKDCGQVIILTHSFPFFEQIRRWFNEVKNANKEKRKYVSFMSLKVACDDNGDRTASICSLDATLHRYGSQYHYFFKKVLDASEMNTSPCSEDVYALPNIARRLLETFLTHRFPASKGFPKMLEKTKAELAIKHRVDRFVNSHSHSDGIDVIDSDCLMYEESQAIMKDVLSIIRITDPTHYEEMMEVMKNCRQQQERTP